MILKPFVFYNRVDEKVPYIFVFVSDPTHVV